MRLVRWVLIFPVAFLANMVGSFAGALIGIMFGQAATDTTGAFVGSFAFVFAAGLIAPSYRRKVGIAATLLVTLPALGTFLLSTFTSIEEFSQLSQRERVLTPVAHFLGAFYALFIFPPVVTSGTTLEQLWLEIISLGVLVAIFGAALGVTGLVVGLIGHGWLVLGVGLGVLSLGAITWLFPYMCVTLRMKKFRQ